MQSTLYPNGFPDEKTTANWQFLTGKRQWFPLTSQGLEAARAHALACADKYEVYFGVLPRIGRSGSGADVAAAACLWVDIDGGDDGGDGAHRLLWQAVKNGLPAPHFTVASGNGIHAYLLLSEIALLPDDVARRMFKDVLKRLCLLIGGKSPCAHADSSRADVASILRVPGTFNRKRQDEPREVQLLPSDPDAPQTLNWWRTFLPALPVKPVVATGDMAGPSVPSAERYMRWANKPFPQGQRHKDLASSAAWLVRDQHLSRDVALQLLQRKASVSPGIRPITDAELEGMVTWA